MGNKGGKTKHHSEKTSEYINRSTQKQNEPSSRFLLSTSNTNQNLIFPINSEGIQLIEGNGIWKGILYCGRQYSSSSQCKCGNCDGRCGPHDGCACPECESILSYMLYSTGKMKCGKCNGILIRLSLRNLQAVTKSYSAFICDICRGRYDRKSIQVLHCFNCEYDVCPPCALKQVDISILENSQGIIPKFGRNGGEGLLYCGRTYGYSCLCGKCNGSKKKN